MYTIQQCKEVLFARFLSDGLITVIVVKPPERKLAKRTSVQWVAVSYDIKFNGTLHTESSCRSKVNLFIQKRKFFSTNYANRGVET